MPKQSILDTSEELVVQRLRSGVKLVRPEETLSAPSIKSLFKLPFNVYFLNRQSVVQNMSEMTAALCGFQSRSDAMGKTARSARTYIFSGFIEFSDASGIIK